MTSGKEETFCRFSVEFTVQKVTIGVDVEEIEVKKGIISVWDFAGQEEYYPCHQFFLSPDSLFLILFNLNDPDPKKEIAEWMNIISNRMSHSSKEVEVILVGTHLDPPSKDKAKKLLLSLLDHFTELRKSDPFFPKIMNIVAIDSLAVINIDALLASIESESFVLPLFVVLFSSLNSKPSQ